MAFHGERGATRNLLGVDQLWLRRPARRPVMHQPGLAIQ